MAGSVEFTFIYSLSDPFTHEVMYVGKANNLKTRLYNHMRYKGLDNKCIWINSLKENGLSPIIEVIDIVPFLEWEYWEKYWISQFKAWGFILKNTANGGCGIGMHSKETSKKISDANKGNAAWNKGMVLSDEHVLNMKKGMKGAKRSADTKERMKTYLVGMKGKKHSEESKEKMRKAKVGIPLSEEHKNSLKGKQSGNKNAFYGIKYFGKNAHLNNKKDEL